MILDRLMESRAEAVNLAHPKDPGLVSMFGIDQDTVAGVNITEYTAPNIAAVYCAVRGISETIGGLDRAVFNVTENGDSELVDSHEVTQLIRDEPNPNMTPSVFWEVMQSYLLLWGNSFAEIERSRMGLPVALWPRHPSRVQIERADSGRLVYRVFPPPEDGGEAKTVAAVDMLHVPCMGTGEVGVSVVTYARESLGLGMAAERLGGAFFGNGAKLGGILKLARPATKERKGQIADDWQANFGGAKNSNRIAVLDHDSDYTQIGIPPEDAQFLQTREFQVQEVSRWFRISPTKLMDFSRATFSNIEEINKQYATETIIPWAKKWSQECRRKLIDKGERTTHIVKHDISNLIEGDLDTQTQIFSRGRQWGWYSINDVRRKLGENTIGPDGDEYLTPQNMQAVGEEPEESEEPPQEPEEQPPQPPDDVQQTPSQAQAEAIRGEFQALRDEIASMRKAHQGMREELVQAVHAKYARKACAEVRKAARTGKNIVAHMDKYLRNLEIKLRAELETVTATAAADAQTHITESRESLLAALECQPDELTARLDTLHEQWAKRYV